MSQSTSTLGRCERSLPAGPAAPARGAPSRPVPELGRLHARHRACRDRDGGFDLERPGGHLRQRRDQRRRRADRGEPGRGRLGLLCAGAGRRRLVAGGGVTLADGAQVGVPQIAPGQTDNTVAAGQTFADAGSGGALDLVATSTNGTTSRDRDGDLLRRHDAELCDVGAGLVDRDRRDRGGVAVPELHRRPAGAPGEPVRPRCRWWPARRWPR